MQRGIAETASQQKHSDADKVGHSSMPATEAALGCNLMQLLSPATALIISSTTEQVT
jgi:hypothetical protein